MSNITQTGTKFSDYVRGLPAASESDLSAGNKFPLQVGDETKGLPGDLVKSPLETFSTNVESGKVTFSNGAINGNSGIIVVSDTRVVCNEVFEKIDVAVPEGYLVHSVVYYSSYTNKTHFVVDSFSAVGTQKASLGKSGCVLKFTIRKADGSAISVDDILNFSHKYSPVNFSKVYSLDEQLNEVFEDKVFEQSATGTPGSATEILFENVPLKVGCYLKIDVDGDVFKNGFMLTFLNSDRTFFKQSLIRDGSFVPVLYDNKSFKIGFGGSSIYSSGNIKVTATITHNVPIEDKTDVSVGTKKLNVSFRDGVYYVVGSSAPFIQVGTSASYSSMLLDITQYRGKKLAASFVTLTDASAKSFFMDKDFNLISLIYGDGSAKIYDIPENACYLGVSNRTQDLPSANTFFYIVDNEPQNKYIHFSLDDVTSMLQHLVDNEISYNSIFDEPSLSLLKQWHDLYGMKVSLFVQRTMADIPAKFKAEIIANKHWIKWGYHGKNNDLATANYEQAKTIWNTFVDGVMNSIGDYDVIDRCPRLDYFHCTLEGAKGLRDAKCGVVGLLSCDDWAYNKATRATNYYLTDDQSTWLDTHDKFVDSDNQLTLVKTDFRLEQIISRWTNTANCLADYESANRASEAFALEIFSHENLFATYTTAMPAILEWAFVHGYRNDYPMNSII